MLAYPFFIGTWEIVLLVLLALLLFGGKKIPELMKGLGKGVKSFKQGMAEIEDEVNKPEVKKSTKKIETTLAEDDEKKED